MRFGGIPDWEIPFNRQDHHPLPHNERDMMMLHVYKSGVSSPQTQGIRRRNLM
jgi:hypothetical protein